MQTTVIAVPIAPDRDGMLRVGKTRVTLETVVATFNDGATAEEIALAYPTLKLADIYTVLSYYLQNRDVVDAYLSEQQHAAAEIRERIEARFPPEGIRERLLARRGAGK